MTAVVVVYNNATMAGELLRSLLGQTYRPLRVVVVDNASDEPFRPDDPRVEVARLPENAGSAGGYHEGFKRALEGSDFVATFDDDVDPAPDCVERLVAGFERLGASAKVGAVRAVGDGHAEREPTPLEIAPWRGTLFSAAAVREVGLPAADYFLYGEDLEYSLRLRRRGYGIYWIPGSVCVERRQGKTADALLGRKVAIYPSAFRLYYAFRNETAIYLAYRRPGKLARTLLYALKVLLYLTVRDGSPEKRRAVAAGLADGFRGRKGRNAAYLPAP